MENRKVSYNLLKLILIENVLISDVELITKAKKIIRVW